MSVIRTLPTMKYRYKPKLIPSCDANTTMTYVEYYAQDISLSKYKVRDLQKIARHNALSAVGPKHTLIPRLERFFMLSRTASIIQRFTRGALCRLALRMRRAYTGAARTLCKNATDFYTMEPVDEIPDTLFVRYTDVGGFAFAFNIHSLMAYYKVKGVFINPYNREEFPRDVILAILRFYILSFVSFKDEMERALMKYDDTNEMESRDDALALYKLASRAYAIEFALYSAKMCKRPRTGSFSMPDITELRDTIRDTVLEVRTHAVDERMKIAFDEINTLGNYSSVEWFAELEKMEYVRFYNYIYNVWRYRGGIPVEAKERICCLGDPFNHRFILRFVYSENTIDRIRELCISLVEDLVFTGVDVEFRKLGALHVLTALTLVSAGAREQLPWLFESII